MAEVVTVLFGPAYHVLTLLNKVLITDKGYRFGNINETKSSVLGKNQLTGTLTNSGKMLVWILDKIENNHALKSIDEKL